MVPKTRKQLVTLFISIDELNYVSKCAKILRSMCRNIHFRIFVALCHCTTVAIHFTAIIYLAIFIRCSTYNYNQLHCLYLINKPSFQLSVMYVYLYV